MNHRRASLGVVVGVLLSLPLLSTTPVVADGRQAGGRDRHGRDAAEERLAAVNADAVLYELTENVHFDPVNGVIFRDAVAALMGAAKLGTPWCPSEALITNPEVRTCTVTAVGTDSVSLVTGRGPVSAPFAVVINAPGNSSVHVPDLPVLTGTFSGEIDLSPAVHFGIPLGSLQGSIVIDQTGKTVPLSGTFRLPFALDAKGYAQEPGDDRDAFYLGDDGRLIQVQPHERALGFPIVRLEIRFGQ